MLELFFDELIKPDLEERHEVHASCCIVEPSAQVANDQRFVDHVHAELRMMVERVRHDLRRGNSSIVSATAKHTRVVEERTGIDFARNGERVTYTQVVHRFDVTFQCTGRPIITPRASALVVMDSWLLVDSVEYLDVGLRVYTPDGELTIVRIDAARNLVKLSGMQENTKSFPIYAVGDYAGRDLREQAEEEVA